MLGVFLLMITEYFLLLHPNTFHNLYTICLIPVRLRLQISLFLTDALSLSPSNSCSVLCDTTKPNGTISC